MVSKEWTRRVTAASNANPDAGRLRLLLAIEGLDDGEARRTAIKIVLRWDDHRLDAATHALVDAGIGDI